MPKAEGGRPQCPVTSNKATTRTDVTIATKVSLTLILASVPHSST